MIDSKWYMEAEGQAREVCACRDILEWLRTRSCCPWPNHNFFCVCVRVRVCVSFSADDRWHCFISRVLQRRRGPGRVRLRTCRWDECVELCLLWNLVYFSLSFFELLPRSFSSLSIMSHGSFKCNLKKTPTFPLPPRKSSHSKHNGVLSVCQKFKEHFLETGESSKNALSTPSACSAVGSPTRSLYCV